LSDGVVTASAELTEREETIELPGVIAALGDMKSRTVITEEGIARLFGRCTTTVKRAVERGELPPPCRLFGQNTWTVGVLMGHIENRLEEAAAEKAAFERKIKQLSP
jgi:hypothetical protein